MLAVITIYNNLFYIEVKKFILFVNSLGIVSLYIKDNKIYSKNKKVYNLNSVLICRSFTIT